MKWTVSLRIKSKKQAIAHMHFSYCGWDITIMSLHANPPKSSIQALKRRLYRMFPRISDCTSQTNTRQRHTYLFVWVNALSKVPAPLTRSQCSVDTAGPFPMQACVYWKKNPADTWQKTTNYQKCSILCTHPDCLAARLWREKCGVFLFWVSTHILPWIEKNSDPAPAAVVSRRVFIALKKE